MMTCPDCNGVYSPLLDVEIGDPDILPCRCHDEPYDACPDEGGEG